MQEWRGNSTYGHQTAACAGALARERTSGEGAEAWVQERWNNKHAKGSGLSMHISLRKILDRRDLWKLMVSWLSHETNRSKDRYCALDDFVKMFITKLRKIFALNWWLSTKVHSPRKQARHQWTHPRAGPQHCRSQHSDPSRAFQIKCMYRHR